MSSPCRTRAGQLGVALALLAVLAGCGRETRDFGGRAMLADDRDEAFGGNAWQIAQGQQLFGWMNCTGCHSHGGGGMGPPLMDSEWRYGGAMPQIVATILDGRPNGMPSFRGKVTEVQAWQLAAYVRSLSARTREDALAGRAEEPATVEPPPLQSRRKVKIVTPEQDDATNP